MKKSIKRLVAVLVVMTMIVTMCSTAFAAGHGNKKSSQGSYKSYTKEVTEETQVADPVAEDATEDQAVEETAEITPEETVKEDTTVTYSANIWKKAQAYTEKVETTGGGTGTAMTPVADVVYYLKEVPNGYIRPYIHYTYDDYKEDKPLKKLYVITAADDTNYTNVGYIVAPSTDMTAAETRSLLVSVKKSDGTIDATLTAKSIFNDKQMSKYTPAPSGTLSRGYLHWSDFSSYIGKGFTFQPCWTTLDKVNVKGLTVRTVNNGTSGDLTKANAIGVTDAAAAE